MGIGVAMNEDKKEMPTVIGTSRLRTNINLSKSSFVEQVEFYMKNLDRLIDQDTYWFCERIEALQAGNTTRVEFIEKSYLNPLQKKIQEIAERMSKLHL